MDKIAQVALKILGAATALIGFLNGLIVAVTDLAHGSLNIAHMLDGFGLMKLGLIALLAALGIQHAPGVKVLALEAQARMLRSRQVNRGLKEAAAYDQAMEFEDRAIEVKL